MKKLLFFAILGMSTMAFSQSYTYTSYGVATGGATYAVPDANADVQAELVQTAGQKFTKFDLAVGTYPSTPTDDRDKTFGNNIPTPTDGSGTDADRGWTTGLLPVGEKEYYSCIRQVAAVLCPRSPGLWAYHTVNFTEAAKFNPIVRFRDGSKTNVFVISIYSPTDMSTPLYNETVDLTGAAPGVDSADGKAKYLVSNGTVPGNNGSVWYKIATLFTVPSAGNYIVKISQTTTTGAIGLGSFTFWKEAAATAPEVAITAPATNSVVDEGSSIALTAKATAGDGTVSGVEFFDGATSLGAGTDTGGGFYTLNVTAAASKVYDFKAVVTETGGVAPDTGESIVIKVMSIGNADDNFNGTSYPGKPWNNTKWSFGTDNAANFAIGGTLDRVVGVDKYQGVPFFAYDLGAVNNSWDKSSLSLRYVAGSSTSQSSTTGTDDRLTQKGSNVFSFSDDYSRAVTTTGAGRFLGSATDYRFSAGGAWARYSSTFAAGKYKLILRATDLCNANYNVYVRILKADGTVVGSYYVNGGTSTFVCVNEFNATALAGNPTYATLTTPTINTKWIMMNDEISLDGDVIVELSDPDPVLGANSGGAGAFGEFTFEYTGTLSTADFSTSDFKVYTTNRTINVNADSNEDATVTIYDINGKLIATKVIVDGAASAEVSTSGIYIVKAQADGKNAKTVKVVVK